MKIISQHRALVAVAVAGLAVTVAQAQTGSPESQWLWNPVEAVGEAVPPLPPTSVYPVQLLLDDDTSDGGFGVASGQSARQFLWFNQFTPATGFHLDQVWVLFPSGVNMAVGGAVQIAVYEDPDGDPSNGANLITSFTDTIQAADDNTFSIYAVAGSPVIPTGSDLLVGVVPRFIVSGVTSPTSPAALDTTATQNRSWIAAWTTDPPDPPVLVPLPDQTLSLVDAFVPGGGNFMIRAFGTEQGVTEIPTLGGFGLVALVFALLAAGVVVLRRRAIAALATLLFVSAFPAGAVTIDTFTTNQASITDPPGSATTVAGAAGDPIGNRRGLFVDLLNGVGPTTVGVAAGVLTFNVTATALDSLGKAVVTWDGDSNPNLLTPTGLGALNLTASNQSGFRIVVNSATAGTELEIDVYSGATSRSSAARRLPAISAPTAIFIPYVEFRVSASSGASFASVGAIVLTIRGTEVSSSIDLVETTGPTVAGTKTDLQILDVDGDNRVDPGDRVRYTVTVTNTGNEAISVDLNDTVDGNANLIAGSVSSTPVAHNDQYGCFGNLSCLIDGSTKPNLLANDRDPDGDVVTVQTGTFPTTSARGGALTLNSATFGSFTYIPLPGLSGIDSFNYTIVDDNGNTSSATAYLTITGVVWFVDDSNTTPPFLGTFADPFQTLSSVSAGGDPDLPGDTIFVYDDDGTPYPGGIVLEADQTLLGQGVGLFVNGVMIVAPGGAPQITNTAGNGITVAANNTVRGLDLTGTSGYKIAGSNIGTLTVNSVGLTGGGGALDLDNGTLALNFQNLVATSGANGVDLDTVSGLLGVNSSTTISGITGTGIRVTNSTANLTFGATTISAPAGLNLTNNPGATFNLSSLAVTALGGAGLVATSSGTINIPPVGNSIAATSGAAIDMTSTSLGSGTVFTTVSSTASTGKGMSFDNVTGTFIANGGSIQGALGVCFDVNGGSSNISYSGTISCNADSFLVEITARTAGTVTLSGALFGTNPSNGIRVANNTGGTINFNGGPNALNTGPDAAVTLTDNSGATINFNGGPLQITTTTGAGFTATGGASAIIVTGGSNVISSSNATALRVVGTPIGSAGLNFQSISASSTPNGIVLDGTGTSAGLRVTGSGITVGSGGTISNTSGRGATFTNARSISLSNMNFTDAGFTDLDANNSGLSTGDNLSTNAAIHLESVTGVTLDRLSIVRGAEQGINGNTVSNFVLSNSTINNVGDEPDEDGIHFYNMSGTSSINNTTMGCTVCALPPFTGDNHLNLQMQSGTLNLTITGGSFSNAGRGAGHRFGIRGTSNATISLSGVTSETNPREGIVAEAFNSASMNLSVANSGSRRNRDQLMVNAFDTSQVRLTATGNELISSATGDMPMISLTGYGASSLRATLDGNDLSVDFPHNLNAQSIQVRNAGSGDLRAAITNNVVLLQGPYSFFVSFEAGFGNGISDLTVTGNQFSTNFLGSASANAGVSAESATTGSGHTPSLCLDIGGAGGLANTFVRAGGNWVIGHILVRQSNDGTVRLPGYSGGATDLVAVETFLNSRNVATGSTARVSAASTGFAGGAACLQP